MGTKKFELELRKCACGCALTFKTLPSSAARYASITHDPGYLPRQFDPAVVRQVKLLLRQTYGLEPEIH